LNLLPPGLYRKIGLGERDRALPGIAVLRNEITGIAAQQDRLDFAHGSRADIDHVGGVNEMVIGRNTGRSR
jgi:hypothetical protein